MFLYVIFSLALQPNSDLGCLRENFRFTSVTRSKTVGRTTWTGDQFVTRPQPVHKHRKTHTNAASAQAKTFHALDRSATVTGKCHG
jgi:hypothetical protein